MKEIDMTVTVSSEKKNPGCGETAAVL